MPAMSAPRRPLDSLRGPDGSQRSRDDEDEDNVTDVSSVSGTSEQKTRQRILRAELQQTAEQRRKQEDELAAILA